MKTSFISSQSLIQATRSSVMDMQIQLAKAQKEVSTGRFADIGMQLGHRTSQSVSFRNDLSRLNAIIDSNGLVASRLKSTQAAVAGVLSTAQDFLNSLAVADTATTDPSLQQQQGEGALDSLFSSLNVTVNGEHLFAGVNTDIKPMEDYFADPPSPARKAVSDAFVAAFGVSQDSPAAADITPDQMKAFLDGPFADLFKDPNWSNLWSSASDQDTRSRIGPSETIASGTNANEEAFRKLAQAFTMVADLGIKNLNQGAAKAVIEKAISAAGEGIGAIAALQGNLGAAQERVERSTDRMMLQADILNTSAADLERVDPYEASTRVNSLLTQIETSYTLTGRLQDLTLLKYL